MIKYSLGIFIDGEAIRLALFSRGLKKVKWIEAFSIDNFTERSPAEQQELIAAFLKKNNATGCRSVLLIPRRDVIVRQLVLPSEAESNLPKVVEYQLAGLLPSDETSVAYDFVVAKGKTSGKTVQVTLFVVLRSVLQRAMSACKTIGLNVDLVLPSNVGIANYFLLSHKQFQSSNAALVFVRGTEGELVGFVNRSYHQSRIFQFSSAEDLADSFKTEIEAFREHSQTPDEIPMDIFLLGDAEKVKDLNAAEDRFKIHRISGLVPPGFELSGQKVQELEFSEYFLCIAAAFSGLEKKPPVCVNLLPPEERPQKSGWAWASAYVLLVINLILLAGIGLRETVQQRIYSRQLGQEVSRLEPEVKKVRSVESQMADLQRRSELILGFRKLNSLVLGVLNNLSVVLPKNSYVYLLSIKEQSIEINGTSDDAASLPKILDDSPYFKNAEFVAPITRDSGGKEQFRIRMQVESMPQVASATRLGSSSGR